jgi:probable HAF family extracellular repeat protein
LSLSALNNHGETTGNYLDANGKYSLFLEQFGTFTSFSVPFPGVTFQFASDINDAGQIIGGYTDALGSHGFVYSAGTFSKVEFPFGSNANASLKAINFTAINGDVAGTPWGDRTRIVLHTTDHGFGTAEIQGSSLYPITATVAALNNNGQIAGTYEFKGSRDCDDSCPTVGILLNRILH